MVHFCSRVSLYFPFLLCRGSNGIFQSRYPNLKCRTESRNPDCHIRYPASSAYFQFQISPPFRFKIPNPGLLMRKISGISKNLLGTLYVVMCDNDIEGLSGGFRWLRAVNLKPLVSLLFSVKESKNIACENIRFSYLLAAGDVSRFSHRRRARRNGCFRRLVKTPQQEDFVQRLITISSNKHNSNRLFLVIVNFCCIFQEGF